MSGTRTPDVEREEPGVWQRLRRRRVTRTAATYVTVGFAFLEAFWYFMPRLGLVEDVGRVLVGIAVLGFPLAIVLAWTYDLTPQGVVRTPDEPVFDSGEGRYRVPRIVWQVFWTAAIVVGFVFRSMRP